MPDGIEIHFAPHQGRVVNFRVEDRELIEHRGGEHFAEGSHVGRSSARRYLFLHSHTAINALAPLVVLIASVGAMRPVQVGAVVTFR